MKERIGSLLEKLEAHSPGERAHAQRVAVYSVAIGERLGLSDEELVTLRIAAELHDIGKLTIPRETLAKAGGLTSEELRQLRRHPERSRETLGESNAFEAALPGIESHHERWDGAGYPTGLIGEEIPLPARIIAAAEAYDALLHVGWREPVHETEALAEIQRCAGGHFDPAVVEALLAVAPLIQPLV